MTASNSASGSSLRAKIILALVSALLTLLAAEVVCRVLAHSRNRKSIEVAFSEQRHLEEGERVALIDIIQMSPNDRIIFELKRNLAGVPFRDVSLSTNSFGFRGEEIEVEAEPNTVTIVGIGDSVMFGHGVGDGICYLRVLERELRERYPAKNWRVINTGVPAYNTVMELETLKTKALQFKPDLVIINLVPNDLVLPQYVRMEEDAFDLSRSFLIDMLRDLRSGVDHGFEVEEGRDDRLTLRQKNSDGRRTKIPERYRELVGWEPWGKAMDELVALSKEHGFQLLSFSTVENETLEKMIEEAEARGIMHVRLLPEIEAHMREKYGVGFDYKAKGPYMNSDLVVSLIDGHPSELQHRMAAEKILKSMAEAGLFEKLMK